MANILLISPEPWAAHFVSKHHYAKLLASSGHRVYFLEPPQKTKNKIIISPVVEYPGVFVVKSDRVAIGLRFMPRIIRKLLERHWLYRLEALIKQNFDVIWLFENSRFYDLSFAGDRLKIYHQVDINQNFQPKQAAKTSDIVFCTTDLILEVLEPYSKNAHVIHHGVQSFEEKNNLSEMQSLYFKQPGPHLVYVGNLSMDYLDVELISRIPKVFPFIKLHLIGGAKVDAPIRNYLSDAPNVIWWGHVASELLPEILRNADILLVTYLEKHWRDQASPHKIMEYLGAGKVIVTTYTDQYRNNRNLFAMADLGSDYLYLLKEVINNIEYWNATDLQNDRINFSKNNTYEKQLQKIMIHLSKIGRSF